MTKVLLDLLWRDHHNAPRRGARGPKPRASTGDVVQAAVGLADTNGLDGVAVRALGAVLGVSTMSVYTHVNSRDDLLVLMADAVHARLALQPFGRAGWRTRVRRVAEANLSLFRTHPWLLDLSDHRVAFGPGTIAKYDHELHALDPLRLDDVSRDSALTFVLDFARASARAQRPDPHHAEVALVWEEWRERLASYLSDDYPLAQRVGTAAGDAMNAAYSPGHAWDFGVRRVLEALASLERAQTAPEGLPEGPGPMRR